MQDYNPLNRFKAFTPAGPVGRPPGGREWAGLMKAALMEARKAASLGEVPVGALVAHPDGRILAAAGNRVEAERSPAAHAEILALAAAGKAIGSSRLDGCVLVATLEPCLMCAGAIALSRVAGVVFGAADVRAGALISAADACALPLAGRSFWHLGGVLSQECAALLKNFFIPKR